MLDKGYGDISTCVRKSVLFVNRIASLSPVDNLVCAEDDFLDFVPNRRVLTNNEMSKEM
jgi:hypothetical protein